MGPLTRKAKSGVEVQGGAGMKGWRGEAAGEEGSEVRGESAPRQEAGQHKPNPTSVGTPETQSPKGVQSRHRERTVKGKTRWLSERNKSGRVVRDVESRGSKPIARVKSKGNLQSTGTAKSRSERNRGRPAFGGGCLSDRAVS